MTGKALHMAGKANPKEPPQLSGDPKPRSQGQSLRQFLVFSLPGYRCAFPLTAVQEIVLMPLLSRSPGMPPLLEGFLNLGGSVVPVLRPDRLFGLPEVTPGLYTPLILLRLEEGRMALLVESVRGIAAFQAREVRPVPPRHFFNECVIGEVTEGEQVIHLLSPERLLLEKERQCLAQLQDLEQERLRRLEGSRP